MSNTPLIEAEASATYDRYLAWRQHELRGRNPEDFSPEVHILMVNAFYAGHLDAIKQEIAGRNEGGAK